MTKADVLDAFEELSMCTSYKVNGIETKQVPFQMAKATIEPILEQFKGWNMDTTQIKLGEDLPETMKQYIAFINEYCGVPVKHVSNGPGREQIVHI
jgi:adenylosuccinate synthase